MTTRRDFLSNASLTGLGLALAPLAACGRDGQPVAAASMSAATPTPAHTGSLAMRTIPSTGERLPAVGVGTSGSYEVATDSPAFDALREVLKVFFEGGGTVIDTSPNYGNAEDVVGMLLADGGWRDQCFLATKLAADDEDTLQRQWAESKRRLRAARVELLQVHNLRNMAQAWPYARRLKEAGDTRYIGLTHYQERAHADLARWMRTEKPDFVQVNYSPASPQAAETIFPLARDLGIAVIVNRAFDDGRLFARVADLPLPGWAAEMQIGSWAQLFLRFAISPDAVTVVIPATGKPERQADNLKGGIGPLLTAEQQADLRRLFA